MKKEIFSSSKRYLLVFSLVLLVFISGCVTVDIYQKLKRNGTFDMDITLTPTAESKDMFNQMKGLVFVDQSFEGKLKVTDNGDSVTYSFKDISPESFANVVQELDKVNQNLPPVGFEKIRNQLMTLKSLNPENIKVDRQFIFPNNEFTYTIKIQPEVVISERDNIIDDGKVLDEETKQKIRVIMDEIYKKDKIDLYVVTSSTVTSDGYQRFRTEFLRSFKAKNPDGYYVLIFLSTNNQGTCLVESNMWYNIIMSKIKVVNDEYAARCMFDRVNEITAAAEKIDQLSKNNDFGIRNKEEGIKAKLTVEVFGNIKSTNGRALGKDKVQFDIDASQPGEYKVVFDDFFLAPIFGGFWWIAILLAIIIVIVLIVWLVGIMMKMPRHAKEAPKEKVKSDPRLVEYVEKARKLGLKDDEIKKKLKDYGWKGEEVEMDFKH